MELTSVEIWGIAHMGLAVFYFILAYWNNSEDIDKDGSFLVRANFLFGLALFLSNPSIFLDGYPFVI